MTKTYLLSDTLHTLGLCDLLVADVLLAIGSSDCVSLDDPGGSRLLGLGDNRVLANGSMCLGVHGLNVVLVYSSLEESRKVLLVLLWVLLLHFTHVVGDVDTHDAFAVGLGIVVGLLVIANGETGEPLFAVWDVQSTITGTFQSTENLVSSGDDFDTDIKKCLEWPPFVVLLLDVEYSTIWLLLSDELVVQLELS
ncbi:hypothetical protein BaOVIS_025230 [Babesia ovis]|uniref:Uncharacterized protein n=1 Tax=Babesia ovis TaxID=5869 RepID=A0A9W5TEU3_BABOV|nr:hypothetical protein BaOVIS_025230 [Babesia ovis]